MHGAGSARMDRVRFGSERGGRSWGMEEGVGKNKKDRWVSASLWQRRWENTNGSGALLCFQIWSVRTIDHRYAKATGWEWESIARKEKKRKGKRGGTERLSPLKCLYAAMLPRVLLSADWDREFYGKLVASFVQSNCKLRLRQKIDDICTEGGKLLLSYR